VCPFCGAAIEAGPELPLPTRRVGRAAMMAFGAGLTIAGCSSAPGPGMDAGTDANVQAQDAGIDAFVGGPDAAYGGPPFDAGQDGAPVAAYGGPIPIDAGGPAPAYGTPP